MCLVSIYFFKEIHKHCYDCVRQLIEVSVSVDTKMPVHSSGLGLKCGTCNNVLTKGNFCFYFLVKTFRKYGSCLGYFRTRKEAYFRIFI